MLGVRRLGEHDANTPNILGGVGPIHNRPATVLFRPFLNPVMISRDFSLSVSDCRVCAGVNRFMLELGVVCLSQKPLAV
jgi:hypothetical protein